MGSSFSYAVTFFVFLLSRMAWAAAPEPIATLDHSAQYFVDQFNRNNPALAFGPDFVSSVSNAAAGGLDQKVPMALPDLSAWLRYVPSDQFETQRVPVIVIPLESSNKADVLVFLPGLNSAHDHVHLQWMARIAASLKMHFIAVPGPFSADYIAERPLDPSGSFEQEARIAHEVIRKSIAQFIGAKRTGKVHLLGFSYGSFLAAKVVAQSTDSDHLITGRVLLVSLPSSMKDIMLRLDNLMDRSLSPYPALSAIDAVWVWIRNNITFGWTRKLNAFAAKVFAWDFNRDLVVTALDLNSRFGCKWPLMREAGFQPHSAFSSKSPDDLPWNKAPFLKFAEDVRFWRVVQNCTPGNLKIYETHQDETLPILAEIFGKASAPQALDILNSLSDPIIDGNFWLNHQHDFNDHKIYLLNRGGHNGFFFTEWYGNFVRSFFFQGRLSD